MLYDIYLLEIYVIRACSNVPHLMVGAPLNDSVRLLLMGDLVTLTILFSCRDTFRYHDCGGGQTGFRLIYQSPSHSGTVDLRCYVHSYVQQKVTLKS